MQDMSDIDIVEIDNQVKLEKYYNGRKLRHYLQLLELAESICRSSKIDDKSKTVARGFANHYRRMVTCIVIKPFNPDETDEWNMQEKVFTYEMSRLGSLLKFADDEKN